MSVTISTVNTGTAANDGTGDSIRVAFTKVNSNFSNVQLAVNYLQTVQYGNSNVATYLPGYAGNISASNMFASTLQATGVKIDSGYQYYAPTTNFTYNINQNINRFILDPTGTITNGNVLLPSNAADATVITLSSTQTVTNFKVTAGTGTTLVPSANVTLTAGTGVSYFYHASESKWYKVQ
jgi:hypothetical protein